MVGENKKKNGTRLCIKETVSMDGNNPELHLWVNHHINTYLHDQKQGLLNQHRAFPLNHAKEKE